MTQEVFEKKRHNEHTLPGKHNVHDHMKRTLKKRTRLNFTTKFSFATTLSQYQKGKNKPLTIQHH